MYYADIKKVDVANGPGVRVSLFVSGCTHKCKGCFNEEAWDFKYGHEYTMQRPECKKKFLLGEANNSYIDGRSKNSDYRNSSALKTWRREVYERDGYKCQVCGATREETDIEAHHLENFADNQDKRLDVNNGVTLCVKHHKLFHQIYGYHNTTPEQYQEFAKGQTTIPDECREVR